jgi:sugar lactone lactonase YvrE
MHARRLTLATFAILCSLVGGLTLGASGASAESHIFVMGIGSAGSEAGEVSLAGNSGVAVNDITHDVYVADTGNHRVDQFSSAGVFIRAWGWGVVPGGLGGFESCGPAAIPATACQEGLQGSGPGQFTTPTFIAVDNSHGASSGDVYVGDRGTNTVSKFSPEGAYISTTNGSTATTPIAGPFGALAGITIDGSGNLWVCDEALPKVHMFEFAQDGSFLTDWSSTGGGVIANGIDADSAGDLYVITEDGRIVQFTPSGAQVSFEPVNGDASDPTGFALDRSSNELYMDSGGSLIRHYASACDAGGDCAAGDTFGSGTLSNAAGVAVDASTGLVYVADSGDGRVAVFGAAPSGPPSIDSTSVVNVSSTSADLLAQVNPNNLDTHFHFEYVDAATFKASGFTDAKSLPQPEGDLAAGVTDQTVVARIQGLQPETTYRYRVVATNAKSPAGGTLGREGTLTTYASPSTTAETCPNAQARAEQPYAQALPDCRAYEQVTPVEKGDGALYSVSAPGFNFYEAPNPYGVNFGFQASASGDGMAFSVQIPFPGALAGTPDNYLAVRGAGGWSAQSITPPQAADPFTNNWPSVRAYSADLSKAAFEDGDRSDGPGSGQDSPALVPGEPAHIENLFLRDDATNTYQLTNLTPAGVVPAAAAFEGASADFSRIVFASIAQLTPEASNGGRRNLFEWHDGAVSLVGQVPTPPAIRCGDNGPACSVSAEGAALGAGVGMCAGAGFVNAVSADGSKIFFNDVDSEFVSGDGQLYVRENGTATVEISASQKTNGSGPGGSDPAGPRFPRYWSASSDGSKAFFTSCEQLTNNSTANSSETDSSCKANIAGTNDAAARGNDLYQYDTSTEKLSDLTVDHNGDPAGADVKAVLGVSADGSYVYFAANGVLANGATLGNCRAGQEEEQCNLYVAHDGTTTFIARIGGVEDWARYASAARVSGDGARLAFETPRSLTGYDNRDAVTGEPDSEVYLYDAPSNQLVCVSCNPSGARPLGPSTLKQIEQPSSGIDGFEYLPRNLSEDGGRLFFDSSDALVPGDVNGKQDVYEYEDGALHLISSGTSSEASAFLDASPDGSDVFFETHSQLVKQDLDQKVDIYDARVDGGFTEEPATACTGTGCQGVPGASPTFATPASATFNGTGNFPPPAQTLAKPKRKTVKCAKGKKLSHGKCVKAKAKKRKSKKAKKASDNRRAKR